MKDKFYKSLEKCAYWGLPGGIYHLLKQLYGREKSRNGDVPPSAVAHLINCNKEFLGKHQGARCFILATGPSISHQDLRCLSGEHCIAVSHFFLHKDIQTISPRYHIVAPYHAPFTFADIGKLVEGMHMNYSDDTTCFFCHTTYQYSIHEYFRLNPRRSFHNAHFIDYSRSTVLDEQNHKDWQAWNIAGSPFQVRTVVYAAIQLALYMGFKDIYLLGCDHDYLHDIKRVSNHHFYKEVDGVSDVEHLSAFTTERWFEEYYFRWKQYRLMQGYAQAKGCCIFNATEGGMLDVFPRAKLSDVLD